MRVGTVLPTYWTGHGTTTVREAVDAAARAASRSRHSCGSRRGSARTRGGPAPGRGGQVRAGQLGALRRLWPACPWHEKQARTGEGAHIETAQPA